MIDAVDLTAPHDEEPSPSSNGPDNCAHCGVYVPESPGCPPRSGVWCSDACVAAWNEAHPGYWTPISALTPAQRAELDCIIGKAVHA